MSLCDVHWYSNVLQKHVAATVLLPDIGEPPFATYYLLHGLTDDHTGWLRRSRVEVYARELPLIVVMPDGFRGFYTDNAEGPAYGAYVADELVRFVERNFPAKRDRSGRCIGGLSMGGYGAMRIALAHPDRYVSANSHSGALLYGARNSPRDPSPMSPTEQRQVFGPTPVGSDHDLFALANRAVSTAGAAGVPKFMLDCGTEDHLLGDTRLLHEELGRLGVPHDYAEHPGAHDWDYWERHLPAALAFHARALGIVPLAAQEPAE